MKILHLIFYFFVAITLFSCGADEASSGGGNDGRGETGTGGSMARFAIKGNFLYTVNSQTIKTFDISVPQNPAPTTETNVGFGIETIFPHNEFLFIGSQNGMYVYSLKTPENPTFVSNFQHIKSCDPVVVNDSVAFITLNTNQWRCGRNNNLLQIVDISDKKNPKFITEYQMIGPLGLGLDSTTLFVCDNGLKVYDATNVLNLKKIAEFSIKAYDVIPLLKKKILIVIGDDGLYQYSYNNLKITLLSKIGVSN